MLPAPGCSTHLGGRMLAALRTSSPNLPTFLPYPWPPAPGPLLVCQVVSDDDDDSDDDFVVNEDGASSSSGDEVLEEEEECVVLDSDEEEQGAKASKTKAKVSGRTEQADKGAAVTFRALQA